MSWTASLLRKLRWPGKLFVPTLVLSAAVYSSFHYLDSEAVTVNLATEAIGVGLTAWLLDAVWQWRQARHSAPLRAAAFFECFQAYKAADSLWTGVLNNLVSLPDAPAVGGNFPALVQLCVNLRLDDETADIAPARKLGDHLLWQQAAYSQALDRTMARFAPHLPPQLIASAQNLEHCKLAVFLSVAQTVRQEQNGLFRRFIFRPADLSDFVDKLELFRTQLLAFAEAEGVDRFRGRVAAPIGEPQLRQRIAARQAG